MLYKSLEKLAKNLDISDEFYNKYPDKVYKHSGIDSEDFKIFIDSIPHYTLRNLLTKRLAKELFKDKNKGNPKLVNK